MKVVVRNVTGSSIVVGGHNGLHLPAGGSVIVNEDEVAHPEVENLYNRGALQMTHVRLPSEWSDFQTNEYRRLNEVAHTSYMGDVGLEYHNTKRGVEFFEYLQEKIPNKKPTVFFAGGFMGYIVLESLNAHMFHNVILPGIEYLCKKKKCRLLYAVKRDVNERLLRKSTLAARIFLVWEGDVSVHKLDWDYTEKWPNVLTHVPPPF